MTRRCWFEPNAFDILDSVADNGYAYSFRDGFCAVSFERPERRSITSHYATCQSFQPVSDTDLGEQFTNMSPMELREAREASLDTSHRRSSG